MFTLKGNLKFININQDYLKYLHGACPEIYYKPHGYEKKPYLGILLNQDGREYIIPLSSAKEKGIAKINLLILAMLRFLSPENSRT